MDLERMDSWLLSITVSLVKRTLFNSDIVQSLLRSQRETCSFGNPKGIRVLTCEWQGGWKTQYQGLGESEPKLRQSHKLRCDQWGAAEQYSPSLAADTQEKPSLSTGLALWLVAAENSLGTRNFLYCLE